ncbi:hypothetical protein HPB47_027696, partial [Ixodes persulcatus]
MITKIAETIERGGELNFVPQRSDAAEKFNSVVPPSCTKVTLNPKEKNEENTDLRTLATSWRRGGGKIENKAVSEGIRNHRWVKQPTPNTPVDSKKEEFRKYLEKSGLFDALTKALVNLFDKPERPENAVAYLKACLDGDTPEEDAATLKRQLDETIKKFEALQLEHDELRSQ